MLVTELAQAKGNALTLLANLQKGRDGASFRVARTLPGIYDYWELPSAQVLARLQGTFTAALFRHLQERYVVLVMH